MIRNIIPPKLIITGVLILIAVIVLPVLMYDLLLAGGTIDYSWSGVCTGSLTNLSEKQLLKSGFTVTSGSGKSILMSKSDTWRVSGNLVPVRIKVVFQLPLYGEPEFCQPEKMIWQFPLRVEEIILAELLDAVSDSTPVPRSVRSHAYTDVDSLLGLGDTVDMFAYDLEGKQYFFSVRRSFQSDICEISTEIFYGKLFLMLKYYVSKFYDLLPEFLTPHWQRSFVAL